MSGSVDSSPTAGHHFLCPATLPADEAGEVLACACELIDAVFQHSAQVLSGYVMEKSVEAYNTALQDVREAVNATYMQTRPWNTLTVADVIHVIDLVEAKHNG